MLGPKAENAFSKFKIVIFLFEIIFEPSKLKEVKEKDAFVENLSYEQLYKMERNALNQDPYMMFTCKLTCNFKIFTC